MTSSTNSHHVPVTLYSLRAHSIFVPPPTTEDHAQDEHEWEFVNNPAGPSIKPKKCRIVTRGRDLIVCVGRELRMTNLGTSEWEVKDGKVGSYCTLKCLGLKFDIETLVVNTTGRLLAVVGEKQVAVVVLPKSMESQADNRDVECTCLILDPHEFTLASSNSITKVTWHPWGEGGRSLWVLTSDGKLREYDVAQPEDATQIFSFLPSAPGPSTSRFTAVDPLAQYATSFQFYPSQEGFGEMMTYVLTAGGDLYLMGPIMPLKTQITKARLQELTSHVSNSSGQRAQWVSSLVRQTQADSGVLSPSASRRSISLDPFGREGLVGIVDESQSQEEVVKLHPPHLTRSGGPAPGIHRPLLRQGSIVFSPAPPEGDLAEDSEDVANDLALASDDDGATSLAIAWSSGRVDLGLVVDLPEPKWMTSRDAADDPPVIPIIQSFSSSTTDVSHNPSFFLDPRDESSIYVQYGSAIDCISLSAEYSAAGEPVAARERLVDCGSSSTSITGCTTVSSIALGNSLLALASTYQVAAVELDPQEQSEETASQKTAPADLQGLFKSLLETKTINYEGLSATLRPKQDLRGAATAVFQGKPIQNVSPAQLRQIGQLVASVEERIQAVRAASQAIQDHLDICVEESKRQLRVLKDCRDETEDLRDSKIAPKAVLLLDKQIDLSRRADEVAKSLQSTTRGVSQVEKEWFDELERIKSMITGTNGNVSFEIRLDQIKDKVGKLREKGQTLTEETPQSSFAADLKDKAEEIRQLMNRMQGLSVKIGTVGQGEE